MKDEERRGGAGRRYRFDTCEHKGQEGVQVGRVSSCSTVLRRFQLMECIKSVLNIRGGPPAFLQDGHH